MVIKPYRKKKSNPGTQYHMDVMGCPRLCSSVFNGTYYLITCLSYLPLVDHYFSQNNSLKTSADRPKSRERSVASNDVARKLVKVSLQEIKSYVALMAV